VNERNVSELERLIWLSVVNPFMSPREIAEGLSRRGVLAPGALTDGECLRVESAMEPWPEDDPKMACCVRRELECIAKGETA